MKLLSANFTKASDFESKQYFDLFIELLDEQYESQSSSDFNPNDLLSSIIEKIKAINSGEDKNSSETMYTGMIKLMTKIIANFDISICEEIVKEKGLIEEIFVNLIFSSVFVEGENKGIKSPSYALKSASFRLILYLVRQSPILM